MISRRETFGLPLGLGLAAIAVPASACRVLQLESRTPAGKQIADITSRITSGSSTDAIVAPDDVRSAIDQFVSETVARRDALGARNVNPLVSKLYEKGADEVYLANFSLESGDRIVVDCADPYENNHAILSFRAGVLISFQAMPIFNSQKKVRLRG